jgi:hypothetical protein
VGISNRSGRDRIVTIIAFTERAAAEGLMENLAGDLRERGLIDIQPAGPYTLSILAGLAEGKAGEDIDVISGRAGAQQKEIARFQCGAAK